MSNKAITVYSKAFRRQQEMNGGVPNKKKVSATKRIREVSRDNTRIIPSDNASEKTRNLPTRDEIQEFSFRLRDEINVKVQAEVPYQWQKELEKISRRLDVKKLELYRFIIGEFIGKVHRKKR